MDMTGYGLLPSGRHGVNRRACESLGYTREELIGNTPLAFHMDSYKADMESIAERAAESVLAQPLPPRSSDENATSMPILDCDWKPSIKLLRMRARTDC